MGYISKNCVKRSITLILLGLIILFLSSCSIAPIYNFISGDNAVLCIDDKYSSYAEVVKQLLPSHTIVRAGIIRPFDNLGAGSAVEGFDPHAVSALETGVAKYWYPQYLATVVIAVDRDGTDAKIKSWSDLLPAGEKVGVCSELHANNRINNHMLTAAVAYGLEGKDFSLSKAIKLLASLNEGNNLVRNSFDPPVLICYDFQAAEMIKNGRNMEVIVPSEGTLTYEKGLLSNKELLFSGEAATLLLAAGFRLLDGRCDAALYPDVSAYENAVRVADYNHFSSVSRDTVRLLRRDVFHIRMYTSADDREHQFVALIYIIVVIVWLASIIQRVLHKGVRLAYLMTGILLLGWIFLRLVKYQLDATCVLNRYLWYGFYPFQLALPLVLLWLAWVIDKPDDQLSFPKWLWFPAIFNGAVCVLTFTNDIHFLTFPLDVNNPRWDSEYGYGIGFYLMTAGWLVPLLASSVMLLIKSGGKVRKIGAMFPMMFFIILAVYGYGYVNRIPIAYESDITFVIGVFTLLFAESIHRTGMVPVNTKYKALFIHSPLGMRIFDRTGHLAWASASVVQYNKDMLARALSAYPLPTQQDENTLLFAAPITGGHALWQEDISGINRLHKAIEDSVFKLKVANSMLMEEEEIKRTAQEEIEKTQLMAQLEAEISLHIIKLSTMIEQLENVVDRPKATARITLLLCYIKRRCNLFFREKEANTLAADELTVYLDELAEIAEYSGVGIILSSEIKTDISIRRATLFYDFYYSVIYWATWLSNLRILADLNSEGGNMVLRLMMSENARSFQMEKSLQATITAAGGTYSIKDIDEDTVGISLLFAEGWPGFAAPARSAPEDEYNG